MAARVTFYLNGPVNTSSTLDDDGEASLTAWKLAVQTGKHHIISVTDARGANTFHVSTAAIQMIVVDR